MQSFSSLVPKRLRELYFNPRYLREHHCFALCKYDLGIKLTKRLNIDPLVLQIEPIGRKPNCEVVLTRASLFVRKIAGALASLIRLVHDSKLTLDGCLKLEMLYWIPRNKVLKIGGLRSGDLKEWNEKMAVRDYLFICAAMYQIYASRQIPVPRELEEWLYNIKIDPLYYRELIPAHMFLLDDEVKVGTYMILFQKSQQLKIISTKLYNKALSYVCAGNCEGLIQWPVEFAQSDLLEEVKNYKDSTGRVKRFEQNEEGLVLCGRHSCSHLLEKSVQIIELHGSDHLYVKIRADEIFSHIDSFAPGLFEQLQKGMFVIQEDIVAQNLPRI